MDLWSLRSSKKKIGVLESNGAGEHFDLEICRDIQSRKSEVKHVVYRKPQKVKVVVTRKQLEFLLRNAKDFHISKMKRKSSWHKDGYRKWQPSLTTIKE
ncbi:hypothetical protein QVD17_19834 [Tagetes erecta]|uniref:Uncharacterized protein n=1 Tax=Tagetes erecta TaxID=13708 RepID=A0AAD8NXK3_TARER|nr:hypothetical protein QVD17_19834 [Tagetes erecta]